MKNLNQTLTIAIPVFNEEFNIKYLLGDLLKQKISNVYLREIRVVSDGSTDNTIKEINKIRNPLIRIASHKNRIGKPQRQQEIIENTFTDILVILDGDTRVFDKSFIEKLIEPIINKNADLTSASVCEMPTETMIEKVLKLSMDIKRSVYETLNNGVNVYTCHGRARAFSRAFYKTLNFRNIISEDAYTFFACISSGARYKFSQNARIYYKLPSTLEDHTKQSTRFFNTKNQLVQIFGSEAVDAAYQLPRFKTLKVLTLAFVANPIIFSSYILILLWTKTKSALVKTQVSWQVSQSSKRYGGS